MFTSGPRENVDSPLKNGLARTAAAIHGKVVHLRKSTYRGYAAK